MTDHDINAQGLPDGLPAQPPVPDLLAGMAFLDDLPDPAPQGAAPDAVVPDVALPVMVPAEPPVLPVETLPDEVSTLPTGLDVAVPVMAVGVDAQVSQSTEAAAAAAAAPAPLPVMDVAPAAAEAAPMAPAVPRPVLDGEPVAPTRRRPGPAAPPPASEAGVVEVADEDDEGQRVNLDEVLLYMLEHGGSDLHLSVGAPPLIRVRGDVQAIPGYTAFTRNSLQECMYAILSTKQKQKFEETKELDLAYAVPGAARFRVNMFQQRGSTGAVLRTIPWEIKSLDALGMPPILASFANLPRGLVLVTGPTGSGKSTTLAAIIDKANRTRKGHIMTIEDPIEFIHQHRMSVVNQREVGEDTQNFQNALKHVLRQDPDIILVGEMRDLETISIALTAAETGHLVFGTLHTSSAPSTIDRVIDVFPPEQQQQIRTMLSASLQAVVCQALCKTADGAGRAAALEIMIATPAIRNLIREGKLQSIPSAIQTGAKQGMQTLNQHLAELVRTNRITYEEASAKASDITELNQMLGRIVDE